MLNIRLETVESVTVGYLSGSLDAATASELKTIIDELVHSKKVDVVFNLSELELIDSSGVGAIVSLFKRVRTLQGDVKIAEIQG